jgi:hydrophobic/amphiphilic exporter-1 (mainly G- bacteria), HAE1 family
MNLSEIFIKRPVATTLIMLGILVFGMMAYRSLPVSDLPVVDFPTIQVQAGLPGASPETMASSVALPLEKQFSAIAGLTSINSVSSLGSTNITLQFDLSRNIDAAAQDVQAMIARTTRSLPPNMPAPPSLQKNNPTDQSVLFLVLMSKTLPLSTIDEYAQTLAQRISMVNGVAQVNINGSQKGAVRVEVDPHRLAVHGIGIDEVASAVTNGNVNLPTGTMYGEEKNFVIKANGQLLHAAEYGPIIVAYRNGNPVRLSEIARVYDGVENDRIGGWFQGDPAINLAINKQPGTNVVQVVDSIKELLPSLSAPLPAALTVQVRADRSLLIRESVQDVKTTLMLAIVLVVLVIFLFLRNISATIIPSLAIPGSIIATFAVMYQLGYSLNNLSLMALTLCVGFVVDNTIVMLENIVRHEEMGKTAMQASYDGSKEVAFTILAMTISLTAVFVPILFLGGVIGRLLREFAVTIGVAILVSGFVSISLTPMMCSLFLKNPHAQRHGRFYNATERMFEAWLRLYDRTLRFTLRHRAAAMALSLTLIGATVYVFTLVPKGFLPSEDQGRFNLNTEGAQGMGYQEMVRHQQQVAEIVAADPNVMAFTNQVGFGGGSNGSNQGSMFIELKPRDQRNVTVDQVMEQLRPKVSQVPGLRTFLVNPPPINIAARFGRALYQFTLQDTDTDELYHWAPILEDRLKEVALLQDVNSDLQLNNPQITIDLNRDRISALGLTVNQVETAMFNAYGTRQISQIYAPNNQYQVILGVGPQFQRDPSALSQLYVRSSTGRLIALDTVARARTETGPLTVSHTGQLPSVTISFNIKPGVALGDAVTAVQQVADNTLPSTVTTSFQGAAQAFQESLQGLGIILAMAILVIYLVLGILYESFTHPLTILSGLPSAGFGALLTLLVFKMDLSVYAFVGIIMLVGLVKKNGIMMVDFAIATQREGVTDPVEAIHRASLVRFRPIMMTTMAALVGTLPIAVGMGAGAESRRPLGMAVVGGLLVSQLLTLYITPVYYVYIERARGWLGSSKKAVAPVPAYGTQTPAAEPMALSGVESSGS